MKKETEIRRAATEIGWKFTVKILRASERALDELREKWLPTVRHKHVATHGMRFIQYRVMNDSLVKSLRGRHVLPDNELDRVVSAATHSHFTAVVEYIAEHLGGEYLQTLFKNTPKVKAIDAALNATPERKGLPREVQRDLLGDSV